jgi:hypothetical protein
LAATRVDRREFTRDSLAEVAEEARTEKPAHEAAAKVDETVEELVAIESEITRYLNKAFPAASVRLKVRRLNIMKIELI